MAPLTYIQFLIPKWPVLFLASVISLLHLEFSPSLSSYDTKDLYDSYDYIIVGGGTAGCVLANRLSADPHRTVLLIEAGGIENAATDIPLFALLHFHGEYDWDYRTEPQQKGCLGMRENRCDWARGKALGGSSVTNFQLFVRGNKRDFDHVVFDNKRAVAVKFVKDGKEKTVRAKREVVLSAGTIGSTQLLLLSGVGPRSDLDRLGIPVVADLPVGENLQDHLLNLGTAATTTRDVEVWPQSVTATTEYALLKTGPFSLPAGIEATAFMNTSFASREYPDFQLYLLSISGASVEGERFIKDLGVRQDIYDGYFRPKRGSNAFHIAIGMNRLKSRGFIKLRSRNYKDAPILDPRYYTHPDDVKMAAEAMGQVIRLMKTKAFAALGTKPWDVHFPPCKGHSMWSNEYMQCMATHLSPTSWHQCCTNPWARAAEPSWTRG
ncbi:glucose dehydrogenase [FAD, quinone] [Dermacentor silvarum]|uniref:glucose dehydrogenase [FAD, quinone] n=1 Tax=Dermacentor silvarum TaxID=543639 RepID=UPI002100A0B3|nr:glucose dehydrogenase [FAD, quinone] [Dermacentor silvarum]